MGLFWECFGLLVQGISYRPLHDIVGHLSPGCMGTLGPKYLLYVKLDTPGYIGRMDVGDKKGHSPRPDFADRT